jgi:hypothetical protein
MYRQRNGGLVGSHSAASLSLFDPGLTEQT